MESNNNTSKIALIVLAVLTAVFGVLYFRSNQLTKEQATSIEEKATELANTRVKLDSISTQLILCALDLEQKGRLYPASLSSLVEQMMSRQSNKGIAKG